MYKNSENSMPSTTNNQNSDLNAFSIKIQLLNSNNLIIKINSNQDNIEAKELISGSSEPSLYVTDLPAMPFSYSYPHWNNVRNNYSVIQEWLLYDGPGIYVVECLENGYVYVGETENLKSRFQSTYSSLKRDKHGSPKLQKDWKLYGSAKFVFKVVYMDFRLESKKLRKQIENILVYQNEDKVYNEVTRYNKLDFINESGIFESFQRLNKVIPWFDQNSNSVLSVGNNFYKLYSSQSGIYAVCFFQSGFVYFGETKNFLRRYKEIRRKLYTGQFSSKALQNDVNIFGMDMLWFMPLYKGFEWSDERVRKKAEAELILLNKALAYNTQHVPREKTKKVRTSGINGFARPVEICGIQYKSIGEAKSKLNLTWKYIDARVNDANFPDWKYVDEQSSTEVHLGPDLVLPVSQLPPKVYLIGNKVFKSQRSMVGLEEFDNLSKTGVATRLKSARFPTWRSLTRDEFLKESKSQHFEIMW